jgi:hypothetical protein
MTQCNNGGAACTRMVTMWAMAMAVRLAGDKEDKGKGGKGNGDGNVRVVGNKEDKGSKAMALATRMVGKWTVTATKREICNGNNSGRQATVTTTKRVMVMAMRVAGDKEGNGDGGKSNGISNKGGGQETATRVMAMVTMWAMAMLAGNKEGMDKGAKSMATAMRVAGEEEGKGGKAMAMATRVVGKWTLMASIRAMVTKTREEGIEEGNGKSGKSNGNGKEDGNGEHQW